MGCAGFEPAFALSPGPKPGALGHFANNPYLIGRTGFEPVKPLPTSDLKSDPLNLAQAPPISIFFKGYSRNRTCL